MSLTWQDGAVPIVGEYLELRAAAGLGPRSAQGAARGLAGSLYSVCVRDGGRLVGMGRVVGDGGLTATVVDIAVDPAWRRQGIGRGIVERLMAWCAEDLPPSCYVCLIADPGSFALYGAAGFEIRTGMAWTRR